MTSDGLTAKQKTRLLSDLKNSQTDMPFSHTYYVMLSTTRNARYIVRNPQQLNALYARLNAGIGLDGQKALQYRARIVAAIEDKNTYTKSIARTIGVSVPIAERELNVMAQMGIIRKNGNGAYARIELVA